MRMSSASKLSVNMPNSDMGEWEPRTTIFHDVFTIERLDSPWPLLNCNSVVLAVGEIKHF